MQETGLLGEKTEVWTSNFRVSKPTNHVMNNMIKMTIDVDKMGASLTPSEISKGAKKLRAHSHYKPNLVEIERKRMDYERRKIKNLIGNNPFRVKNYVQGDNLDNNLVPLKLLKPKKNDFKDDDEFIENYLLEKDKEEKIEAAERKKKMKKLSLEAGLARGLGNLLKQKKGSLNLSKRGSSIISKKSDTNLSKLGNLVKNSA